MTTHNPKKPSLRGLFLYELRHFERSEDNSEGECCKNELADLYNRAKELGL